MWSIGFMLIGIAWPVTWVKGTHAQYPLLAPIWAVLCLVNGIFPMLSVEKTENLLSVYVLTFYQSFRNDKFIPRVLGGFLIILCGWIAGSYELEFGRSVQLRKRPLSALFCAQVRYFPISPCYFAHAIRLA
jgi:hypothetical protein